MTAMHDDDNGVVPEMTLGWRIVRARGESKMTRKELADALGYDPKTIYGYESDTWPPRPAALMGIARVTGVNLRWLETGDAATPKGDGIVTDLRARRDSNSQPSDWEFAQVTRLKVA